MTSRNYAEAADAGFDADQTVIRKRGHVKLRLHAAASASARAASTKLTRPGETIEAHGVSILGPNNLPSEAPFHASQMYAKNISTLLLHLVKDGKLTLDLADEITRETLVCRDGQVVHPRVQQLLAPAAPGSYCPDSSGRAAKGGQTA